MNKQELKSLIREEIQKILKENASSPKSKTQDPKTVKQYHDVKAVGFYVAKGGTSYGPGSAFDVDYNQFDPEKAKWLMYSPNENDVEKYKKDGYIHITIDKSGETDIAEY
jgi:hypothetical protein